MKKIFLFFVLLVFVSIDCSAIDSTVIDTCSNNKHRSWWDVQHYTLQVNISPEKEKIEGAVTIQAKVVASAIDTLQIDLQEPLRIKKIIWGKNKVDLIRAGNHYLVIGNFKQLKIGHLFEITVVYDGVPQTAKNPPWSGGFIRTKAADGTPWIAVACQGIGASSWWPCKDDHRDEPDLGVDLYYQTSATLKAIGNGKLYGQEKKGKNKTYHWRVENPINLYDVTFYIGNYVHFSDTLQGKKGVLDLDYYVLADNLQKAKKQFQVVKPMLHCFEYWLGPYPFYEDGYKLVEAPYLGMEHQSAIAYGNNYKMGYAGVDRSKTGIGLLFDFIIVHESAHEWFGNSISANDIAYSWIHEGFTTYCETLFAEYLFGKDSASQYQRGQWKIIRNKKPIEGKPNACDGGSADQYEKAAAMVHMIRQIIDDDEHFRHVLHALNKQFYHKTIDGITFEKAINRSSSHNFSKVFEQYLRTTKIPILVCKVRGDELFYRWQNVVADFDMPVLVYIQGKKHWLEARNQWKKIQLETKINAQSDIKIDADFLIGFAVKK